MQLSYLGVYLLLWQGLTKHADSLMDVLTASHRDESDACVGNDSLFAFWLVGPAAQGKNYGQIRNFTTSESEG